MTDSDSEIQQRAVTRRQFLAATAGGLAVAGCGSSAKHGREDDGGADKIIDVHQHTNYPTSRGILDCVGQQVRDNSMDNFQVKLKIRKISRSLYL